MTKKTRARRRPKDATLKRGKATESKQRQKQKRLWRKPVMDFKDAIERGIGAIVELFVGQLQVLWAKEKTDEPPLSRLQRVLTSEGRASEAAELATFAQISGIKSFAVVRGTIQLGQRSDESSIDYLLAVPVWDRERLNAIGTSDEFHTVIYWDSRTWPKQRVIVAGLEEEEEGLRRSGGVKLYH